LAKIKQIIMDYKDITKEELDELKKLIEQADLNKDEELVFGDVKLNIEYAKLLYIICENDLNELKN
jgi:hypothetical protein